MIEEEDNWSYSKSTFKYNLIGEEDNTSYSKSTIKYKLIGEEDNTSYSKFTIKYKLIGEEGLFLPSRLFCIKRGGADEESRECIGVFIV